MNKQDKQFCNNACDEILDLLYEISNSFPLGQSLDQSFSGMLDILAGRMRILGGIITILNRKTSEIIISESYGLSSEEKARGKYKLGEGITGKVIENGNPIIVQDVTQDKRFLNKTGFLRVGANIGFLSVPVQSINQVIGSISIYKEFINEQQMKEDKKILIIISNIISRAVSLYQNIHEEQAQLIQENMLLHEKLVEKYHPDNTIGNTGVMRDMYKMISKVARGNSTVIIFGESGVGKELVARAIHFSGDRASKSFVTFNCAALPESLIESELFGYHRGAFTGAVENKKGKFQAADKGTIFLDEVGELSIAAQTKLLRVLQEREVEPLGSSERIRVDVRVLAATNRDLWNLVSEGRFREDLFFRLNVFPITVPPLRKRKADIPLLADSFIEKYSQSTGNNVTRISTPAIDMLMAYHWPGNVRELENCIERAVVLAEDDVIHGYHLPPSLQKINKISDEDAGALQKQLDVLEYEIIVEELKRTDGSIRKAAGNLGISYRQFGIRIEKYNIDVKSYKKNTG